MRREVPKECSLEDEDGSESKRRKTMEVEIRACLAQSIPPSALSSGSTVPEAGDVCIQNVYMARIVNSRIFGVHIIVVLFCSLSF